MYKYIRLVILMTFLMLMLVYSCKKESPSISPTNPSPFPHIDSFVGTYHIAGYWYIYQQGNVVAYGNIDSNIIIGYGNSSSLIFSGNSLNYTPYVGFDSVHNYTFVNGLYPDNYFILSFKKPYNDSIFYQSRFGGLGGFQYTLWSGKKNL